MSFIIFQAIALLLSVNLAVADYLDAGKTLELIPIFDSAEIPTNIEGIYRKTKFLVPRYTKCQKIQSVNWKEIDPTAPIVNVCEVRISEGQYESERGWIPNDWYKKE